MVVDTDKLFHDGFEHVQHAPFLRVDVIKVQLGHYLVDVVQVFDRKVLESWILSSLTVNLQENSFVLQLVLSDYPVKSVVGFDPGLFRDRTQTDKVEVITVIVRAAIGSLFIGAVELVVRHDFLCGHLTAEVVSRFNPKVYQGF